VPPTLCHPATYLTALRDAPEGKLVRDIIAELGVFEWTLSRWRKKVPGFKDEERQIKARKRTLRSGKAHSADRASAAAALAAARAAVAEKRAAAAPGEALEEPYERFLAVMDAQDDRAAALRETGLSWDEVQTFAKGSEAFSRRYTAILDRWRLGVEDATMRAGKEGDMGAARMYLQAHDPLHFTPRMKIDHRHDVQVTAAGAAGQRPWLNRFREPLAQVAVERVLTEGAPPDAPPLDGACADG
jgi:hypothetical protein